MLSGAGSSGSSWSAVRSGRATEETSREEVSERSSDISELSGGLGDIGTGVEWSGVRVADVGGMVDLIKYVILIHLATFCFSTQLLVGCNKTLQAPIEKLAFLLTVVHGKFRKILP